MLVYIATRLENHAKYGLVRDALNKIGVKISYDWTTHGPVWRDGEKRIREISIKELDGVKDADVTVIILPGGRGTHCELGMALALDKKVFILAETQELASMQGATPETCAFYHHPNVYWTYTIPHLINYLTNYMSKVK